VVIIVAGAVFFYFDRNCFRNEIEEDHGQVQRRLEQFTGFVVGKHFFIFELWRET